MFVLMIFVFVVGYAAIAFEHPLKVDKAASALLIGVLTWTIYLIGAADILPENPHYLNYLADMGKLGKEGTMLDFIIHHEIMHHLAEIAQILFFLLGAMTIVELVDSHEGFAVITDKINTDNRVKLLWIISILTFFFSAALDNLSYA